MEIIQDASQRLLYVYSKGIGDKKSPLLNQLFPSVSSMQVKSAFDFCGKFYSTRKDRKEELMKEIIKRVKQITSNTRRNMTK